MPFAASTTTRSGRRAASSTKESTFATKPSQTSVGVDLAASPDVAERALCALPDLLEPRVAADGQRARAHDLHPGVLLRVVRRGDAHAAVEPELADREVDHLGADEPEVEDVGAAVRRALDQRCRHRGRREAHVPSDRDPPRLELLDVAPPDPVCAVLVQLGRVDSADVVRLEDGRVEHVADARGSNADRRRAARCGKPPRGAASLDPRLRPWSASSRRRCSSISSTPPHSSSEATRRSSGAA